MGRGALAGEALWEDGLSSWGRTHAAFSPSTLLLAAIFGKLPRVGLLTANAGPAELNPPITSRGARVEETGPVVQIHWPS
jgi:hypothetical protein